MMMRILKFAAVAAISMFGLAFEAAPAAAGGCWYNGCGGVAVQPVPYVYSSCSCCGCGAPSYGVGCCGGYAGGLYGAGYGAGYGPGYARYGVGIYGPRYGGYGRFHRRVYLGGYHGGFHRRAYVGGYRARWR